MFTFFIMLYVTDERKIPIQPHIEILIAVKDYIYNEDRSVQHDNYIMERHLKIFLRNIYLLYTHLNAFQIIYMYIRLYLFFDFFQTFNDRELSFL